MLSLLISWNFFYHNLPFQLYVVHDIFFVYLIFLCFVLFYLYCYSCDKFYIDFDNLHESLNVCETLLTVYFEIIDYKI